MNPVLNAQFKYCVSDGMNSPYISKRESLGLQSDTNTFNSLSVSREHDLYTSKRNMHLKILTCETPQVMLLVDGQILCSPFLPVHEPYINLPLYGRRAHTDTHLLSSSLHSPKDSGSPIIKRRRETGRLEMPLAHLALLSSH